MQRIKVIQTGNLDASFLSDYIGIIGPVPSFRSTSRQKEWIGEHILAREMFGKPVRISHMENGAPYIDGTDSCISISHTRNLVSLLVSDRKSGIDIEAVSPRALKVASRFLTEKEIMTAGGLDELKAVILWTVKEAVFKASGLNPADFLHEIGIVTFGNGSATAIVSKSGKTEKFQADYVCEKDYVQTVAFSLQ